jgi:hypothetical protein
MEVRRSRPFAIFVSKLQESHTRMEAFDTEIRNAAALLRSSLGNCVYDWSPPKAPTFPKTSKTSIQAIATLLSLTRLPTFLPASQA